ncbi:hypothetical protein BASA81_009832 [Batrachochytrium salamandrivorans]|nr:hypothetical protein BASA81_009832 [Batrachochytrium salamandrivorans]
MIKTISKGLTSRELQILRHAKVTAEREMFVMQGVIILLNKQMQDMAASQSCSVCLKSFDSAEMYEDCLQYLEAKRLDKEQLRLGDPLKRFKQCAYLLRGQTSSQASNSRLQFYLRSGMLAEFRSQKFSSLKAMQCVGCRRGFTSAEEFASFLKRLDDCALRMDRDLHIHGELRHGGGNKVLERRASVVLEPQCI